MYHSTLTDVPGLLEELFPDAVLPFSVDELAEKLPATLFLPSTEDPKSDRWAVDTHFFTVSGTDGYAELCLANFLNTICTALRDACEGSDHDIPPELKWSSQASNDALTEGPPAQRRPDVLLGDDRAVHTWKTVAATVELKSNVNARLESQKQVVDNAFMVLSSQDERRFFIGTTFTEYDARVYFFDRVGLIGSESFDVRYEPLPLIRLLAGLTLTERHVIGFDPTIIHEGGKRYVDVQGKKDEILELLFQSECIRGRGTVCWRARREGIDYVIKDTWVDLSRSNTEASLLSVVSGIEGISTLVDWEVVKNGPDERHSTASIREFIMQQTTYKRRNWLRKLEVGEHLRIVSTPCAVGLSHFSSKRELLSVLIDAIKAHQGLLEKGILHRDVNLGNIMIYQPTTQPADVSVSEIPSQSSKHPPRRSLLIDLDYAILVREEERIISTGYRTGTLPFMAVGLLAGHPHAPRHDLESFFYVLVWICWHYAGPNNAERKNFDITQTMMIHWITGDQPFDHFFSHKIGQFEINVTFENHIICNMAPYFEPLKPLVRRLRDIFFGAEESDVSHQNVIEVFQKAIKSLPTEESWSAEDDPMGYGLKGKRPYRAKAGTVGSTSQHSFIDSEDESEEDNDD